LNRQYSSKVQQRRPVGPPYVCSDRASSSGWGAAGRTPDSRRWTGGGQPVTWANTRLIGPVTLASRSPSGPPAGPFLPAAIAALASGTAALGVPVDLIHSPELGAWPGPRVRWRQARRAGSARGAVV